MIALALTVSGCCCCCGVDGFTSKYQKPVDQINFPDSLTVGGQTYQKVESQTFSTPQACKERLMENLRNDGIDPSKYESAIDNAISASGMIEAKEFVYRDDAGHVIRGFAARVGSPGQLAASGTVGKQLVGSASEIKDQSSYTAGDEAMKYTADLPNGKRSYAIASRSSNMFVFAAGSQSYAEPEQGIAEAYKSIDAAYK